MTPSTEILRLYDDTTGFLFPGRKNSTEHNVQLEKATEELSKLCKEFCKGLLTAKDTHNISYPDMLMFVQQEIDVSLAEQRILSRVKARKHKKDN